MSGLRHLAGRFFGSLSPRPLDPDDDAWVRAHLNQREAQLWAQMSTADRKHAAGVARTAVTLVGDGTDADVVVAAAALHDVGKIDSQLSTVARAVVTVAASVLGRDRVLDHGTSPGWRGRAARYLAHDAIGAALLADAGSDELTVAWARQHHLAPSRWTVDARLGAALAAADDD